MSGEIKRRSNKSSKSKSAEQNEDNVEDDKTLSDKKKVKKDKKGKLIKSSQDAVDPPEDSTTTAPDPPPKFGPMPKLSPHRLWSRSALILGLMTVVWWNASKKNESSFAAVGEDIRYRGMKTKCSSQFDKHVAGFAGCVPNHCGRLVTDELITPEEIFSINDLVTRGFSEAGGVSAAAAVLDLSTGSLNFNGKTVDVYKLNKTKAIFNRGDLLIFQSVKSKMMRMVSSYFGVDYWSLHLAAPVYLSRLSGKSSTHKRDEYWHITVHQDVHDSFDYSTVLFLSNFNKDVEGGRIIFTDGDNTNRTVDPRKGRALAFTSGQESRHFNERVTKGTRFALTMGFTCDAKKGKKDPTF